MWKHVKYFPKSSTVVVAFLDTGVDFENEGLKDVQWINKDEIPNNNKDDDNIDNKNNTQHHISFQT